MARIDTSVTSDLTPAQAWALASDLGRFDQWLTIFSGWRSPVPDHIEVGTTASSSITVKGIRNTIHWKVTDYCEPERISLAGSGRGGVHIDVRLTVNNVDGGSSFHLSAHLHGGLLSGPVGSMVAQVIANDVTRSVHNLARMR